MEWKKVMQTNQIVKIQNEMSTDLLVPATKTTSTSMNKESIHTYIHEILDCNNIFGSLKTIGLQRTIGENVFKTWQGMTETA